MPCKEAAWACWGACAGEGHEAHKMRASAGRSGLSKTNLHAEIGMGGRQWCRMGSVQHLQDQGVWVSNGP